MGEDDGTYVVHSSIHISWHVDRQLQMCVHAVAALLLHPHVTGCVPLPARCSCLLCLVRRSVCCRSAGAVCAAAFHLVLCLHTPALRPPLQCFPIRPLGCQGFSVLLPRCTCGSRLVGCMAALVAGLASMVCPAAATAVAHCQ
jgi:hypothetical protein